MAGLSAALQLVRPGFRLEAAFELQPGRITGLNGASGAGKTTLLRCLAGLQRADDGHIALGRETWYDQQAGTWLPAHRRRIGYVAQEDDLFPHLDVRGNLALAGRRDREGGALLAALGVEELLARPVAGLSGGQAQRVRVARALLRDAPLLLLDEPLNMLDIAARATLLEVLAEQVSATGRIALLTSHAPEDIAQVAAETIVLQQGRVQMHGPTATVLNDTELAVSAGPRAGALLACRYTDQPGEHGLQALQIGDRRGHGVLWIAAPPRPAGTGAGVYVHARDVSLARTAAADSSIQNILPARIQAIRPRSDNLVMVELRVDGQTLHACITHRAQARLQLAEGEAVYAQIKSVSLLG